MRVILIVFIIIGLLIVISKKSDLAGGDYNFYPDRDDQPDNNTQPDREIYSDREIHNLPRLEVVARTLYGEGREGSYQELKRIAMVIENRVKSHKYPSSYKEVCLEPMQFSCWNNWQSKDSNNYEVRKRVLSEPTEIDRAKQVARSLLNGSLNNYFDHDVLHYFSKKYMYDPIIENNRIVSGAPYFAIGEEVAYNGDLHVFVKGVK